jgi:hypothetical protein
MGAQMSDDAVHHLLVQIQVHGLCGLQSEAAQAQHRIATGFGGFLKDPFSKKDVT